MGQSTNSFYQAEETFTNHFDWSSCSEEGGEAVDHAPRHHAGY